MPPGRKMVQSSGAKRVTLKFLAEHLGLSPTTVSVVLTNSALSSTLANPTKDRIWQAEGKIFLNTPLNKEMPVPVVAISDITNAPGVTRIVIDNYQAVLLALRHLKELGHRRIAFFKGPEGNGDTDARWKAIVHASSEMGIQVKPELTATMGTYFAAGEKSMMQRGYEAAQMLMRKSHDFTAL